jgi:glycerol-3-phosphate acyltransferase PlsY
MSDTNLKSWILLCILKDYSSSSTIFNLKNSAHFCLYWDIYMYIYMLYICIYTYMYIIPNFMEKHNSNLKPT